MNISVTRYKEIQSIYNQYNITPDCFLHLARFRGDGNWPDFVKAMNFLCGISSTHPSKPKDDIWYFLHMSDDEMENRHDWIQWAFPIDTVSPHNPYAGRFLPDSKYMEAYFEVLTHKKVPFHLVNKIEYFVKDVTLNLTIKYFDFLGIHFLFNSRKFDSFDAVKFTVRMDDNQYNHNFKRISRVLTHLAITNVNHPILKAFIDNIFHMTSKATHVFNGYTVAYWYNIKNIVLNGEM